MHHCNWWGGVLKLGYQCWVLFVYSNLYQTNWMLYTFRQCLSALTGIFCCSVFLFGIDWMLKACFHLSDIHLDVHPFLLLCLYSVSIFVHWLIYSVSCKSYLISYILIIVLHWIFGYMFKYFSTTVENR